MGQIQRQLFFNAPLEKVWKIWTDVEDTASWVAGVQESKLTSAPDRQKGLSWQEKCMFGKKMIQMDHEFSVWEPLKKTVISSGLPMGGTMERTADFKSSGATTEVNVSMEWDLGIVGAFFDEDKLQHMMEKSFDETAANWKKKAES